MDLTGSHRIPPAALITGIAGAVPFWLATVLLWSRTDPVVPALAANLVLYYGALVLCFLGGIRWGVAIGPYDDRGQAREMGLSVLFFAAALSALVVPPLVGVSLLICGFLTSALWDVSAMHAHRLPVWFARLRVLLTTLTVPALLFALGRLIFIA